MRDIKRRLELILWPLVGRSDGKGAASRCWGRACRLAACLSGTLGCLATLGCLTTLGYLATLATIGQAQEVPVEVVGDRLVDRPADDAWVEDQYAIAAQHYRQQRWAQAIGQFRLLLDRAPGHARAGLTHFFLAESHVQLEEYAASLPHFEQFLRLEPDHPLALRARFRAGEAHYLLGQDDASIQVLTDLLPADHESVYTEFSLAYLGEMWLRQETASALTTAREYLQRVVREYPESSLRDRALLGLAQAQQKLGETAAAEQPLLELQSNADPVIAAQAIVGLASLWIDSDRAAEVQQILSDDRIAQLPTDLLQARARYWRGRAEMAAKNWSQAAGWIEQSLADLQDPALEQAATYDAAISHWQAGQIERAEQRLTTLLSRWPTGQWAAESQFLLLQAAARQRDWTRVDTTAEDFLEKFPQHVLAHQVRELVGRRALGQGDYTVAQTQFAALIGGADREASPESLASWHYLLGLAQLGLEQWEAGLASSEACQALLPRDLASPPSDDRELSLSDWLESIAGESTRSEPEAVTRTAQERLWEQAQFARATALTRLQRWPELLQAQEILLRRFPDSSYREELWSERLRILVAERAWTEYTAAAKVARRWLEQPASRNSLVTGQGPTEQSSLASELQPPRFNDSTNQGPLGTSDVSVLSDSAPPPDSLAQPDSPVLVRGRAALRQALSRTALQMAEHWYEQSDFAAAIPWYELSRQAEDPAIVDQALAGLAWAEFHTLPPAEAERTARLLLDRFADSPRSAEVGLKLADQLYRDGRFDAASELLETLAARFTTWPRRHQLLALQSKVLGQRPQMEAKRQAIAKLQQAIEALPSATAAATVSAATVLEANARGESPVAIYLYDLAWLWHDIGDLASSYDCFRQINLKHPNSRYWADATFRLAQHHFSQQRYGVANDLLAQLLATRAENAENAGSAGTERDGEARRSLPALTASARRDGSRAIARLPSTSPASVANETSATAAGAGAEIESRLPPELHCQSLYLRAMTAAAEQDWGGVAEWSQRLIDLYPEHRLRWMTQYWRGEADFRQRQYTGAVARLSEILPRTTNQADSWVAMTHLRLAQSLGHLDRWREAFEVAESAQARFTNFAQAFEFHYLIGRSQATEGRFVAARAAYQQVLDSAAAAQSETAAMAQWMIGETYMHQEQYALAAEAYHRVETLHRFRQWQAAALLQAGKCYEQLRRPSDAIGVYRQLLREHADCSLIDDARARLENLTTASAEKPTAGRAAAGN